MTEQQQSPDRSIEVLKQIEHDRIEQEVLIEREWWINEAIVDTEASIASGKLWRVPDEGTGFRLVGKLRRHEESPYLVPAGMAMLYTIAQSWMEKVIGNNLDSKCFLSVASLYRSHEDQEKMRQMTSKATMGVSPHTSGVVVDFDPSGYFIGDDRKSVNSKSAEFDRRYMDVLRETLMEFERNGYIHVIYEKDYRNEGDRVVEYDACYHVCLAKPHMPNIE